MRSTLPLRSKLISTLINTTWSRRREKHPPRGGENYFRETKLQTSVGLEPTYALPLLHLFLQFWIPHGFRILATRVSRNKPLYLPFCPVGIMKDHPRLLRIFTSPTDTRGRLLDIPAKTLSVENDPSSPGFYLGRSLSSSLG